MSELWCVVCMSASERQSNTMIKYHMSRIVFSKIQSIQTADIVTNINQCSFTIVSDNSNNY